MLDKIIIKGLWGPFQDRHLTRLTQISISRFLRSKSKETTTYINSPLTGAQIEVKYVVQTVAGVRIGYVEMTIPVASALIGHNCFHAGIEVLRFELQCLELLVRIILATIGMTDGEIERYVDHALVMMVECTWDTATASPNARLALQARTEAHTKALRNLSARHDIGVEDSDPRDTKSGVSLLVSLKAGDAFRQYCKAEWMRAKKRGRKANHDNFLSDTMKPAIMPFMPMLESHARNELLVGAKTLNAFGIRYLRDLTPHALEHAMVSVWRALGFRRRAELNTAALEGSTALDTLKRFEAGEDVVATLPGYRVSRDRLAILEAHGPDIADTQRKQLRFKAANLGRQLQYPRRWRLPDQMRDLVVSERTAPAIIEELQQGLAFVTDGAMPDFDDEGQMQAWRGRWMLFAQAEQLTALQAAAIG